MEIMTVFDTQTPETVKKVARSLTDWRYDLPMPTNDARCIGFILEQSIALHLQKVLPQLEISLGGAIEYPNLRVAGPEGVFAFEIKASPRKRQISNRVKSPESILRIYPQFAGHWVVILFYILADDRLHLAEIDACILQLWRYAAAAFKDMSAICALGSLEQILRQKPSDKAFRTEREFLDFCSLMAGHPGTTAQRNAAVREWLRDRKQ